MTDVQPIAKEGKRPKKRHRGRARPDEPLSLLCAVAVTGICTGRPEHRHHIRRRSQGGGDEESNTADCCGPCHQRIHERPEWAYAHGWLKRGGS